MPPGIALSAHVSMLFAELPYLERPAAARAAGFDVVETWWPGPELDPWLAEVERHGLAVALLNADAGDIAKGERGFLNVPERREWTLAAVEAAAAAAGRCGAPLLNVVVGRDTGRAPRTEQLRVAAEVLRDCATIAREAGVRIAIEPINDRDTPGYLVPTPADAAALIEAVGADGLCLLYDAYHAARMGLEPVEEVRRWLPLVGHVQYADCPGRGAPGTGEVDLDALLTALAAGGYTGAVGLELDAKGATAEALDGVIR